VVTVRRTTRTIYPLGLLAVAALLEPVLTVRFRLADARPDLVLVLVVAFALVRGPEAGVVWGFVGGFLQDLLSGHALGLEAGLKGIVGFLVGLAAFTVLLEGIALPFVATVAATGVYILLAGGLTGLVGVPLGPGSWQGLGVAACANGAVAPLAFWLVRSGEHRLLSTDAASRRG
jgi:rod shape-determining protein MreD